jgi:Xaa-Pro aminopeptidase
VYLPQRFGVRIEGIVAVTEEGGRRLDNAVHNLATVG